MKSMLSKKSTSLVLIILGVELLVLISLIINLFIPPKSYNLTNQNNSITLPYGRYFLKCNYNISSDTNYANYLHILNDNGSSEGILGTENFLHHEKSEWKTEFWITEPKLNINLVVIEQFSDGASEFLNYASYEIESTKYVTFIGILITILIMICTSIIYFILLGKIVLTRKRVVYAIIMFAVFLISCIPLGGDSLIKGDDTVTHLIRIEGIKDGYLSGQLPVKVEPTLNGGYGYAFSTYYGSLFYNIPAIFRLMGFTIQDAYKLFVVIVNFATVVVAYYSFRVIFKKSELALVATIMYSMSLLRIVDLYQRGAVGEFTALIFLPLIVAGLWKIYTTPVDDKNYNRLWLMPVIGYFGVIESHVLSTEIFGIFTVLVCLIMFKKTFRKQTFLVLLKVVLISVVLNIGYLIPFIESYLFGNTYISTGRSNSARLTFCLTFPDLFKFFYKFVKFEAWRDYMVPGLGPTVIPSIILFIYTLKKGIHKHKKLIAISAVITIITAILSLDIVPYERVLTYLGSSPTGVKVIDMVALIISNMVKNIQFAMRFLTVGTCTYILFVIALLDQYDEAGNECRLLRFAEIFVVMLTVVQFIWVTKLTMSEMSYMNLYTMTENDKELSCQIGNYEYIPMKIDGYFPEDVFRQESYYTATDVVVTNYEKKYTNISMHAATAGDKNGMVELPLLYYLGYKAINADTGEKITLTRSVHAQLAVELDSNFDGNIKIYYAGKFYWHIAEAVSVLTFVLIVIYGFKRKDVELKVQN